MQRTRACLMRIKIPHIRMLERKLDEVERKAVVQNAFKGEDVIFERTHESKARKYFHKKNNEPFYRWREATNPVVAKLKAEEAADYARVLYDRDPYEDQYALDERDIEWTHQRAQREEEMEARRAQGSQNRQRGREQSH